MHLMGDGGGGEISGIQQPGGGYPSWVQLLLIYFMWTLDPRRSPGRLFQDSTPRDSSNGINIQNIREKIINSIGSVSWGQAEIYKRQGQPDRKYFDKQELQLKR